MQGLKNADGNARKTLKLSANFSQIFQLALSDENDKWEHWIGFMSEILHLAAQEHRKGKKSMELGHGITASLSPCVCLVKYSVILTVWNQKEMKGLIIQNIIAKELCGFCFDSIEERRCVLRKFKTVEKKKLLI